MQIEVEERQSDTKYERLSIQRKAGMQVDREICGTICNRRSSIIKCSEIVITTINENTSSSQHKPDSSI